MTKVSMLEFRRNAEGILRRAMRGDRIVLTYRGKSVVSLEPIRPVPRSKDAFYQLDALASSAGKNLQNQEIDRILYGR